MTDTGRQPGGEQLSGIAVSLWPLVNPLLSECLVKCGVRAVCARGRERDTQPLAASLIGLMGLHGAVNPVQIWRCAEGSSPETQPPPFYCHHSELML